MPSHRRWRKQSKAAAWNKYKNKLVENSDEKQGDLSDTLDEFEEFDLSDQFGDVCEDTNDGYKTPPPSTPRMSKPSRPLMATRPRGAFGDVLVDSVELVSVSGAVIANITTDTDDWSTYRIRITAAAVMKVAPKFMNLADASGRLVLDNDPVITQYLTAIVVSELSE
jgi:hypothetical protein